MFSGWGWGQEVTRRRRVSSRPRNHRGCGIRHGDFAWPSAREERETPASARGQDRAVGLGALGQEVMEERPGTSIEFVASLDMLVSGHFAFLSGNPPAYAGRKTPQGL